MEIFLKIWEKRKILVLQAGNTHKQNKTSKQKRSRTEIKSKQDGSRTKIEIRQIK
ncbi:hypothetical protein C2G38_201725 [Gigaspora rosea]|uniref:Uncharacterized protein n=1 Tax=Gigaspora rosea TaxID=44941 RepID=A0A397W345_9GLOM|nr:hypothetical protein C2G38_201725 [Gigaspora rosea]